MSLPVNSQYLPPQSWEEFESLCADLFARIWKDPGTQKHGRQGQPQGGVDVYGRPDGVNYSAIQCKNRKIWPPSDLTTDEIDEEIAKAKTWKPRLKHYIIATTAPNDEKVQAHVRKITRAHERKGLFSVRVASWDEITRNLAQHTDLLRTYGYLPPLPDLGEIKAAIPQETARLVMEELKAAGIIGQQRLTQSVTLDSSLAEALERDLIARYDRAMRRSFFPETLESDEFVTIASAALDPSYVATSSALRRRILLRAARSAAVKGALDKAQELLRAAQGLAGPDSDHLARVRILEKEGYIQGANAILGEHEDSDSRSTKLNLILRHEGPKKALQWLEDEKISIASLTINGLQSLSSAYLQTGDFDGLREQLNGISVEQLSDGPYFRFLRAMANVASILPVPDRELAVRTFQMDARRGTRSVLDASTTAARLDIAISDLTALLPIASELELKQAKRLAESYIRWCELLHPHRANSGLEALRVEMRDMAVAIERLSLAFAFDPSFDPTSIEEYLKAREELGVFDDNDLKGALIVRIHSGEPASVAAHIAKYRSRYNAAFKDPPIFTIEIQALAFAGDTSSARLLLHQHRDDLTAEGVTGFEALIAKCEGKDPVAEDLRVYESTRTVESLRTLVESLAAKKDHRATAKYSEELYGQSSDPRDIARAAQALALIGDGAEFTRVVESHPFLKEQHPQLLQHYAWECFRAGRLKDGQIAADQLPSRDLQLDIAIAIESGEWESLSRPLSAFMDDVSKFSGLKLIQAAHLAQSSGQGPLVDLLRAAVSKAGDNPHVWLGAYTIVIEEGLEEAFPEAHDWLSRALVLSDKRGPVQQFELKDLIPQQAEWNKRTADISARINRAEVPLAIAAPGLRTTVVDILLRNLVRNSSLEDGRKKYVIPLFSGHRPPERVGQSVTRLGLDISGLLVLGWLGLLPKVFNAFDKVALPATILTELFNGRHRVQHVQKSRIKRARELEQTILRSRIKIARPEVGPDDPLSAEVGPSLAGLIRMAHAEGGIVLRPGPIHQPGLDQKPADVTDHLSNMSDMHSLLKVLVGAVSQPKEDVAKNYFNIQDKGLPNCCEPDPSKPLFIDELALSYLQYTDLLDPVLRIFKDVRIDGGSEDEALAIIDHHQHVEEVLKVIGDIRSEIRKANAAGKVSFGPRHNRHGRRQDESPSTLHLLSDLTAVDAVVCDDRALNKENFAADPKGTRIPCLSTLDVLEELRDRFAITEAEWLSARHKLRISAATIVPVVTSEITKALGRSDKGMSAELRAIRESIDLARVSEVPSFPREIRWFAATSVELRAAIPSIWKSAKNTERAQRLSNIVMTLIPKPEDWVPCWHPAPPAAWVAAVNRVIASTLALPYELANPKLESAYNEWFEQRHLDPLRATQPDRYREVVEQVRSFILTVGDDNEESIEEKAGEFVKNKPPKKQHGKRTAASRGKKTR